MTSGKFKLARAVGHRGNFAEVEVRLVAHAAIPRVSASETIPEHDNWGARAAVPSVLLALETFDSQGTTSAVIENVRVVLSDSTPCNVATAAYIATARAFGTEVSVERFIQNDRIVFPGIAD